MIACSSSVSRMDGPKDTSAGIDRHKKRKKVTSWVPVSTQYNPKEGHSVMTTDNGNQCITMNHGVKPVTKFHVRSVHSQPSLTSDATDLTQASEIMYNSVGQSTSSINSMDNSKQNKVLDQEGMDSTPNAGGENMSPYHCVASDSITAETVSQEQSKQDDGDGLGLELNAGLKDEAEIHSASVEVDASLLRFVKGKGGATQSLIEKDLVIQGSCVENVSKAADKINRVLEEAINSSLLDYSHFVSLPLAIHPELVDKLNNFQNSILGNSSPDGNNGNRKDNQSEDVDVAVKMEIEDDKEHVKVDIVSITKKSYRQLNSVLSDLGIDRSIFIKPKTFHLTVLMLKLWNKERVAAATEVLQNVHHKVLEALENRPISIRLKGLECMKGSPAKARVLYSPIEEIGGEGRLMHACRVITEAYVEAGLVLDKDARQSLKLHATLMNARHRKGKTKKGRHDSFDARSIFKMYSSEDWGEYLIPEVHLSQRFAFDENGYYHCCASIPFPENMKID
ncbi:hypothetical protein Taro_024625 [Colocasia esculenta]|uniref:A-kinase anchor protein 7-like phosphoesterase domain-containing protein n=1 Tax=Colocasia esculenta TaxID=4460 RepID=A0A843VKW7_COLES|nr:hypothetical protein [Colocasia esculenta]